MLEVFSKDRETDFEFFRFTNGHVNYLTKNIYDMDEQDIDFYCGLPSGTILIDNEPIDVDNVSSEEIKQIKAIMNSLKSKVYIYKKNYKPVYMKVVSEDMNNVNVVEVPDWRHFKEWTHITGFEYLQNFMNEYKNTNKKIFRF